MTAILFVRIKTGLNADEVERCALERRSQFIETPGLIQKFFGRDDETGDVCGIYLFKDQAALAAYRQSDLAKSIPAAYEASDVRPEKFDLLFALREDNDVE